jgi:serine protease Do
MEKRIPSIGVLVLVAACSALVGMYIATSLRLPATSEALPFWKEGRQESVSHVLMPSLRSLAKTASPTVVNIRTTRKVSNDELYRRFENPGSQNEWFDEFFRKFFEHLPEQDLDQRSLGSGFIISRNGYVLTNNHVISGADEIFVSLSDESEQEYRAKVAGKDDNTDIALIKIQSDRDDFPVAVLGDSDSLEIGDWIIAIGNPFGFGHTLTQGIVSAKARVIGAGPYDNFIQTDAAINPGNSGGPLINMDGEVVGINTAIVSSAQGIGFAIPINMAKQILQELRDTGEVSRGWLGVAIQEVTPEIARAVGLGEPAGAMVTAVYPGDPAERAGVKNGDIILEINRQKIQDPMALTRLIGGLKPEEKVTIIVWRDTRKVTLSTRLEKRSDDRISELGRSPGDAPGSTKDKLGLVLGNITPEIQKQLNLDESSGVLVIDIDAQGSASGSKLQKMDVIRQVNGIQVKDVGEYLAALEKAKKGQAVLMLVIRNSKPLYVAVDVE